MVLWGDNQTKHQSWKTGGSSHGYNSPTSCVPVTYLDARLLLYQMRGLASVPLLKSSFTFTHFWLTKKIHSFCIIDWYAQIKVLIHSWRLVSVATKLSEDVPPFGHK